MADTFFADEFTGALNSVSNSTPNKAALSKAITSLGVLVNGSWTAFPSIYRLLLNGTGTITIDARAGRDNSATVTVSVASYTATSAINRIEYPYFGDTALEIRATITGNLTAEIL